jgi:hypothetical protein
MKRLGEPPSKPLGHEQSIACRSPKESKGRSRKMAPARDQPEVIVEQQLRRYFIGIISFAFFGTWLSAGVVAAFVGLLAALVAMRVIPALAETARRDDQIRRREPSARRKRPKQRKVVRTRPLAEEDADDRPLIPDDPSLIISTSG